MNENYQPHIRPVSDINSGSGNSAHNASLTGLVRQLANDVTALFTKELALAKVEVTHSIHEAKSGAVSMISGGSILYAGFLLLLLAAVLGLSQVMEMWAASLVVGGVVTVIGMIMVAAGKKKMEPSSFKPKHTIDSLEKDQNAVRRAI